MIAAPYRIPVSNSTPAAPGARVVSNTQNQAYIAAGAALIRFLMQSCGLAHNYGPNGFPADSEELLPKPDGRSTPSLAGYYAFTL